MILITGGTGLVGSYLLYYLVRRNVPVRALYRDVLGWEQVQTVFSYLDKTRAASLFSKIEWVKADITDIPVLERAFKDVRSVYHCAAIISSNPKDLTTMRRVNIHGTSNVVNLCLKHPIEKLCYVSSIAALGRSISGPISEETHWNPDADNSYYGITKYGAEMEVWRGIAEGLDAVIVNPGVILGAGIRSSGSGRLLKASTKGLRFFPTGSTGWVDVEDVVRSMIDLMDGNRNKERYVLVSENMSYKELFGTLNKARGGSPPSIGIGRWGLGILWRLDAIKYFLLGGKRTLTKEMARSLVRNSHYDNSKIRDHLNFTFKPISKTIEIVCRRSPS